jgi:anti-sigma28 factor (negative regulator of flagellin synthesis)
VSYSNSSFDGSESGVFLMEPKQTNRRGAEHRRWLDKVRAMDSTNTERQVTESRLAKIQRIRKQIQNGTYETEAKWEVALNRLLRDIGSN